MRVDIHQHLWTEPLLRELARRREGPRLLRRGSGWALCAPGEPETPVDLADHDPDRRARLVAADGLDRAIVAPSSPLGIEEDARLVAACNDGAAQLPARFGAWAAVWLAEPDAGALARLLDRGFAGACLPACALAGPDGFERLGGILDTLERRGAPLLVHPGPAPAAPGAPGWWPALTHYVTEMQTAWHAFAVWGRPAHPRLRVCFTLLAGLAPLHRERLAARGGGPVANDPDAFLDTSSYGSRAVDAVVREVGVDRLVYGSDRPVVEPAPLVLGAAVDVALRERNPARLLGGQAPAEAAA